MRKVIITQTRYLISSNDLVCHPAVRRCWPLPWGHTLIELDDPIFQNRSTLHPPSRSRETAIVQEAALFAPYYRQSRSLADVLALKVSTQTTWYHLVTASRTELKWPNLILLKNWYTTQQIQIVCRFPHRSEPDFRAFDEPLKHWRDWMTDRNVLRSVARTEPSPSTCVATLTFNNYAADAMMALFLYMSIAPAKNPVRGVIVSRSGDISQLRERAQIAGQEKEAS